MRPVATIYTPTSFTLQFGLFCKIPPKQKCKSVEASYRNATSDTDTGRASSAPGRHRPRRSTNRGHISTHQRAGRHPSPVLSFVTDDYSSYPLAEAMSIETTVLYESPQAHSPTSTSAAAVTHAMMTNNVTLDSQGLPSTIALPTRRQTPRQSKRHRHPTCSDASATTLRCADWCREPSRRPKDHKPETLRP